MESYKTLITKDRLDEIVRLAKTTPLDGILVELGVYKGGSMLYLAEQFGPERTFAGFDTFEGLPKEHWNIQEVHNVGDFGDTSYDAVREYVAVSRNRYNIFLYKGLFPDTANVLNGKPISFVHVDFDFYEGAKAAIDFFKDKMLKGGVMVFDDYKWPNCPGVEQALSESGLHYLPTNATFQAYIQF